MTISKNNKSRCKYCRPLLYLILIVFVLSYLVWQSWAKIVTKVAGSALISAGFHDVSIKVDTATPWMARFSLAASLPHDSSIGGSRVKLNGVTLRYLSSELSNFKIKEIDIEAASLCLYLKEVSKNSAIAGKFENPLSHYVDALKINHITLECLKAPLDFLNDLPFRLQLTPSEISVQSQNENTNGAPALLEITTSFKPQDGELRANSKVDAKVLFSEIIKLNNSELSVLAGDTAAKLTVNIPGNNKKSLPIESSLQLDLKHGRGTIYGVEIDGVEIDGVTLSAALSGANSGDTKSTLTLLMPKYGSISLKSLKYGLALRDLKSQFRLLFTGNAPKSSVISATNSTVTSINFHNTSAKIFGGTISSKDTKIPISTKKGANNWHTALGLEKISIEEILKLYPQSHISATGSISGELPLDVNSKGITIKNGSIKSTQPGIIAISGDLNNTALNEALGVLKNFHYDNLEAEVTYSLSGDLDLALHLKGRNPDWQKGHPVNLNLNISENIPKLLESIRLASGAADQFNQVVRPK